VSAPTDGEINRSLNAIVTTANDQRIEAFDEQRFQEIVDGALAHEAKLRVVATGPRSGTLESTDDGRRLAVIERRDGRWEAERRVDATGSDWARPSGAG
jgi:hypothetical protein